MNKKKMSEQGIRSKYITPAIVASGYDLQSQIREEVKKSMSQLFLDRKEPMMSYSKECQEYHLTPSGWVKGTFKGDELGGRTIVPPPEDRVLTVLCYDELSSAYAEPHYYDREAWESDDKDAIRRLKEKFGHRPDWFGYDLKK
jgi:hypothetical protein